MSGCGAAVHLPDGAVPAVSKKISTNKGEGEAERRDPKLLNFTFLCST